MRLIFAGGGTGGHLYPGLAIARAVKRLDPSAAPYFIGAMRGIEKNVLPDAEFPFDLLDLHPLYRSRPWENWKTIRGAGSAWRRLGRIVAEERPAVIVGTGGYASGIALGYGSLYRIPLVLQEQNGFPGLTTRFFSRYARQVHNGFPEAARHLNAGRNTLVLDSGNPIEPPPDPLPERSLARAPWRFPPSGGHVMLIYGGSQGSKAINDAVAAWVRGGIPDGLYLIWATGQRTHADYTTLEDERVRVCAYLTPVSEAYAAADFALSRGGAIATAELAAWGIPPILVPLPTAAADHQTANAKAMAEVGAAEVIPQSELTVASLDRIVRNLIGNPGLLAARADAVRKRARPHAAEEIARHVLVLAKKSA